MLTPSCAGSGLVRSQDERSSGRGLLQTDGDADRSGQVATVRNPKPEGVGRATHIQLRPAITGR